VFARPPFVEYIKLPFKFSKYITVSAGPTRGHPSDGVATFVFKEFCAILCYTDEYFLACKLYD